MWLPTLLALALAQSPEAPPAEPRVDAPRPLGVTISGGVSLGTYEAGFMYLTLEQLKAHPALELKMVTGASAGSINALVSALASCRGPTPNPFEDPGWLAWGDVGYRDLFDRKNRGEALFTRDALERSFERVRALAAGGLPESCDVVMGVVVTRVTPRQVLLQKGLTVPRLDERFLVRIQGRGAGKAPRLTNYVEPDSHLPQPLLPFVEDDGSDRVAFERNFNQLRALLFASAAFPVAFAPQPIEYCLSKPPKEGEAAGPQNIECRVPEFLDLFVDGGVFDNNPLRLAYNVSENRLTRAADGRARWRELFEAKGEGRSDILHLYLDPDTSAYPPEDVASEAPGDKGLIAQFFKLGGGFVESARAKELSSLAEERKDLAQRMKLTVSQYPKASEHLSAFVGFFEKDFRVFDFYLGMYDAYRELKAGTGWHGATFDVDALVARSAEAHPKQWQPFLCMLGMYEPGREADRERCKQPELRRFAILLQTSIDRVAAACRPTPEALRSAALVGFHQHCARARQGLSTVEVPGVRPIFEDRIRRENETAFDFSMRLLGAYDFEFTDLGLARDNSHLGRLAIRREMESMVQHWANAQAGFADRVLARTVGRVALNNLQFSPPQLSGHVVVGTIVEGGVSAVPFGWQSHWFQLTGAFQVGQLTSLLTPGTLRLSFNIVTGPEFHLAALSNAIVQPRVALRGGVQLGVLDGLGAKKCSDLGADPRWCTQSLLETMISISLLERVRAEFIWQMYPGVWASDPRWYNLHFAIGVQFL
ncbi:MAG: patatin-like phospholipase family protein [Myxococcota bacterium]